MADRIIVVGVYRGRERVSASEISQMCGRGGRKHDGKDCVAHILVDGDYEEIVAEMADSDSFRVESRFKLPEEVAFHLLPDICDGLIRNKDDAELWFSRSFGAFQKNKVSMDKVVALLVESEAIEIKAGSFIPTPLGKVASRLYFHPLDVKAWKDNFSAVFEMGLECEDLAIAWALGNVPVTRISGDLGKHWHIVTECKGGIPPGLDIMDGATITITLWWCAIGGPSAGKMRSQMLSLRSDFDRIHAALIALDRDVTRWGKDDFLDELKNRVKRGVPSDLAELYKLPGITKNRASFLYSMGVRDAEGIKEIYSSLEGDVDENFFNTMKDIANGSC